jgi:hypothetical protein
MSDHPAIPLPFRGWRRGPAWQYAKQACIRSPKCRYRRVRLLPGRPRGGQAAPLRRAAVPSSSVRTHKPRACYRQFAVPVSIYPVVRPSIILWGHANTVGDFLVREIVAGHEDLARTCDDLCSMGNGMNEHQHDEENEMQTAQNFREPLIGAREPSKPVEPAEAAFHHHRRGRRTNPFLCLYPSYLASATPFARCSQRAPIGNRCAGLALKSFCPCAARSVERKSLTIARSIRSPARVACAGTPLPMAENWSAASSTQFQPVPSSAMR